MAPIQPTATSTRLSSLKLVGVDFESEFLLAGHGPRTSPTETHNIDTADCGSIPRLSATPQSAQPV